MNFMISTIADRDTNHLKFGATTISAVEHSITVPEGRSLLPSHRHQAVLHRLYIYLLPGKKLLQGEPRIRRRGEGEKQLMKSKSCIAASVSEYAR